MKKQNKKNMTPINKLDSLGANVVTTPDYVMRKHGWSAVRARYTTVPVLIAAVLDLVLGIASLFGPIAELINKLITLISGESFEGVEAWHAALGITLILILWVIGCWNKQKELCQAARKSTFTEFYRVKGGEGIVIHTDAEGRKMFPLHGVTKVEKIHPVVGRLEVFLGLLKFDYQPLIKRWLNNENDKLEADEGVGEAALDAVKGSAKKAAKKLGKKAAKEVVKEAAKDAATGAAEGAATAVATNVAKKAIKKQTAKIKAKEKKNHNYCDLKVTFVGAGEKIFYDVENPDAFIEYIGCDTYSPESSVVYKVSKKI
jgi:hypothetical protein